MFTSCKKDVVEIPKDDISQNSNEILLSPPPCSPGSFSITNGSIKFTTLDDYKQTLHFFECADVSTKHDWIMNLPIEVAYTWLEKFTDDIAAVVSDSLDFITVWNDYASNGLIDIEVENGEEFSTAKYPMYKAFIGASGYFMIDQAIISEKDGYVISIPDGSITKLNTALSTMQEDTTNGIYINKYTDEYAQALQCCPENKITEIHAYKNGKQELRLKNERFMRIEVTGPWDWNGIRFDQTLVRLELSTRVHRRGFLGRWFNERRDIRWSEDWRYSYTCWGTQTSIAETYSQIFTNRSEIDQRFKVCEESHSPKPFKSSFESNPRCFTNFNFTTQIISGSPTLTNIMPCH